MPQPFPFYETRGGFRTASIASGVAAGTGVNGAFGAVAAGADMYIYSGQGRLNALIPGVISGGNASSGIGCIFYDAAPSTVVSGGPWVASGHRILGVLPANTFNGANLTGPLPINVDTPFYSGLCAGRLVSGVIQFTVVYTPEYNPLFAG